MKVTPIPPIAHLEGFGTGSMHLLLAHLCDDPVYIRHYKRQRLLGAYLILDNSAHEFKAGGTPEELAAFARILRTQEVVVPDVLDQGPATVERATDALETWFERGANLMGTLNPSLMYVPQGVTSDEYYECMEELISLQVYIAKRRNIRRDFVLGISKDYEDFPGGLDEILGTVGRVRESLWDEKEIRMHVHLLGWHRKLWVLRDLAVKYPWVRSTDSNKPFQYAMKNISLDMEQDPPPYPGRHATKYFYTTMTTHQMAIARHNVAVFKAVGEGRGTL